MSASSINGPGQRGSALLVVMMILGLVTVIALIGSNIATAQMRASAAAKSRMMALQTASIALHEAEELIRTGTVGSLVDCRQDSGTLDTKNCAGVPPSAFDVTQSQANWISAVGRPSGEQGRHGAPEFYIAIIEDKKGTDWSHEDGDDLDEARFYRIVARSLPSRVSPSAPNASLSVIHSNVMLTKDGEIVRLSWREVTNPKYVQ